MTTPSESSDARTALMAALFARYPPAGLMKHRASTKLQLLSENTRRRINRRERRSINLYKNHALQDPCHRKKIEQKGLMGQGRTIYNSAMALVSGEASCPTLAELRKVDAQTSNVDFLYGIYTAALGGQDTDEGFFLGGGEEAADRLNNGWSTPRRRSSWDLPTPALSPSSSDTSSEASSWAWCDDTREMTSMEEEMFDLFINADACVDYA